MLSGGRPGTRLSRLSKSWSVRRAKRTGKERFRSNKQLVFKQVVGIKVRNETLATVEELSSKKDKENQKNISDPTNNLCPGVWFNVC